MHGPSPGPGGSAVRRDEGPSAPGGRERAVPQGRLLVPVAVPARRPVPAVAAGSGDRSPGAAGGIELGLAGDSRRAEACRGAQLLRPGRSVGEPGRALPGVERRHQRLGTLHPAGEGSASGRNARRADSRHPGGAGVGSGQRALSVRGGQSAVAPLPGAPARPGHAAQGRRGNLRGSRRVVLRRHRQDLVRTPSADHHGRPRDQRDPLPARRRAPGRTAPGRAAAREPRVLGRSR